MTTKKKKIIGLILFIYPIPLIVFTIVAYAILQFVLSATIIDGSSSGIMMKFYYFTQFLLSALGMLGVAGIFIGIPLGVILYVMARKQEKATSIKS